MKRKGKKFKKKGTSSLNKLSLFQKSDSRFSKKCPLSVKNPPIIDYKNVINSQIAFYQKYKNHMSLMQRVRIIYSVLYLKIFQKVKK